MEEPDKAGWDAIESAFSSIYGDQVPKHWGTIIPYSLGGNDPLHGISAYKANIDGQCHWHLVSFGLTELWAKESEDKECSGWGFELTMRLSCSPSDESPPLWILNFLQNIARYVCQSGRTFSVGDHMNCNGPIALECPTKIRAFCCVEDPDFPHEVQTPNGAFRFVQLYGITLPELDEIVAWNTGRVAGYLRSKDRHHVTMLERDDFYGDAALQASIQTNSSHEPSSTAALYVSHLALSTHGLFKKRLRITIGAIAVQSVIKLTKKRLGFSKDLLLTSDKSQVLLTAGAPDQSSDMPTVHLNREEQQMLIAKLQPKAGIYPLSSRLEIEVLRSEVKDSTGKTVSTVG